jgi:Domain of unknown function (DUF4394)/Calx-beta domain
LRAVRAAAIINRMPTLRLRLPIALLAVAGSLLCAAPALAGEAAVGVETGADPDLVRFDTDAPGALTARVPISGLLGDTVGAIDVRPATGELWALTSTNRVLAIDFETGAATQIDVPISTPPFTSGLLTGFDFNPMTDRLRLVDTADENVRFDPVAHGLEVDTALAYDAGDPNAGEPPNVVGAAYTNNSVGATETTLFGIDAGLDVLVRQGGVDGTPSPNGGLLFTVGGGLGVDVDDGGFDIVGSADAAFAALRGASGPSTLYGVNLTTGATNTVGTIGGGPLAAMAMLPAGSARTSTPSTAASEAGGAATVTVQRSGDSLAPASVGYRTVDHTAVAGQDYGAVAGTLEFAQGERSKDVVVPLLQDAALEAPESFGLVLGPTSGGIALDTREHAIRLLDDERSTIQITFAADRTAPAFLFAPHVPDHLRALGRARSLRLDVACSERCRVELALRLGRKRIGGVSASLVRAGVERAAIRLTRAGRKAVVKASKARRRGRVRLTLGGSATDAAGNVARRTAALRLARR